MTEIPEHLRKRAEAARAKAAEKAAEEAAPAEAATPAEEAAPPSGEASQIPAHLLERSKSAKARKAGGRPTPTPADGRRAPRPGRGGHRRGRGGTAPHGHRPRRVTPSACSRSSSRDPSRT